MTIDSRYKLIELIDKEYAIFLNELEGLDDTSFAIKMGSINKSPKEILIEQISLMERLLSQGEEQENCDGSFRELKYILNLMYLNLISWIENMTDYTSESEQTNFNCVIDWFDRYLLSRLRVHNSEIILWKKDYKKYRIYRKNL